MPLQVVILPVALHPEPKVAHGFESDPQSPEIAVVRRVDPALGELGVAQVPVDRGDRDGEDDVGSLVTKMRLLERVSC